MGARSLRHWWIVSASCATCLVAHLLIAADTPLIPIQAELVKRLYADKLRLGDSVLARAQAGWKGSSCELRRGDILEGRIVFQKSYSKTDKTSEIAILFDKAQCGGQAMKPLPLTVVAIVAADPWRDPIPDALSEHQSLSDAVGLALNGNVRSLSVATETVYVEPGRLREPDPKEVRAGQVVGISHLKLLVGKGPEGGSILSSRGRELQLDIGTQFVLFPTPTDPSPKDAAAPSGSGQPAEAPAAVPDPPKIADETEVCAPPSCEVAFDDSSSLPESGDADLILPLKGLGYSPPPPERELLGFDYHAGVAFLGPSQLLFTFNPHLLVKRSTTEAISSPGLRMVRAVAVDLATRQVVKGVDWRVPDSGQYFWPLANEQILVHVGDELRVYGPGLEQRKKISLGAPLAFVQTSPSSSFLAVGIVRERHTPEIHRQLQEAESREPEEEIEVRVLDSDLRQITTTTRSSRQARPVVLDDGEVRVFKIGADQWRIVKYTWEGKRRVLAQASSTCLPSAHSLPGDLLLVVGCDHHGDKWYRVLRDGKVLLKGSSSSSEFEPRAFGNAGGSLFVVGIAQTKQTLPSQVVFRPSDLKSERVALYSAKTGHRILALTVSPVVPAVQTFAISPREEELAVLTTDHITLYRIPQPSLKH